MRIGQKLTLPLILLTVFNIITGITRHEDIYYYALYLGVFLPIIILLVVIKKEFINKNTISWMLLLLSVIVEYNSLATELTGISLLFLSMAISTKSKKTYITYALLFLTVLIYKFNLSNIDPSQLMAYLSGVLFASVIYQHYIHPKKDNEYTADYSNKVIEKLYIDIMILYINGYSWNKISSELSLNVTGKSVQRTLDNEWKARKFKNREQFAHYMGQMGIIKQVDKNTIT